LVELPFYIQGFRHNTLLCCA